MKEGDSETDQQAVIKDQEYNEKMQQLRGRLGMRSRTEDSVCINKWGRNDTKRETWNRCTMITSVLFGI